jgi:hypothetical protein
MAEELSDGLMQCKQLGLVKAREFEMIIRISGVSKGKLILNP